MNNIIKVSDDKSEKIFNLLGLATKAGAIIIGMDANVLALKDARLSLLILASDIGDNSLKKIQVQLEKFAENGNLVTLQISTAERLARIVGKKKCAILGVADENFAKGILKLLD